MDNVYLDIIDDIATITFDLKKEKINKLTFKVLEEFDYLLNQIKEDSSIKALVIQSAKDNIFIAGADIKEIEAMHEEEQIYKQIKKGDKIFEKLETLTIPTIAYINGACMGGGLELALACKYRIATTNHKTKLAFPEIKLGFFPGLGGTQRLPKLVGLINSLDMILTGKTIDYLKAFKIGLVDEIFNNGQKESKLKEFIEKVLDNKIKRKPRGFIPKFIENFYFTREFIYYKTLKSIEKKVNREFNAPYVALEVIKQTFNENFEKGIDIEARAFSKLACTKESKYMIELFFMFEKLNKDYEKTPDEIENVAIVGSGTMGIGIIWLFSKFLNEVRIKVRKISQVKDIIKSVSKLYDSSLKRKSLTRNQVNFKLNKISYTHDFNGMSNSDFVIEAVIEDENIKKETFSNLEEVLNNNAIIATNTSSISIEKLSENIHNKKNFLGVHFFNPVNIMPLVEIIPNSKTSKKTLNRVKQMLIKCGKTPIVVGDCTGFIVNRILLPYLNEAAFILQDGSNVEDIDKALKDFGMPMGPFTLIDTVGIDVGYKVATILNEAYGDRMEISPILKRAHDELKLLGKKQNKGFYIYKGFSTKINEEITLPYNMNKQFENEEIAQRCLYIMINEACRCLEEKIVIDASIINFAMVTGTGFPPYKGGLLNYANDVGLKNILNALKEFQRHYGKRFKPSNLLIKLVEEKKDFKTGEELWNS